jgi:AraC-like DNA-binding protein
MNAQLEKIVLQKDESFFIGVFQDNLEKSTWHYHNNYELSFITEGVGKRIVGDSIEEFHPGDLIFIGRNLPHVWIADKESFQLSNRTLESVFLQFTKDIFGNQLIALPEFTYVAKALSQSERGVKIPDDVTNEISELLLQMPYLKPFERMIHFFRIMDIIGHCKNLIPLASEEYIRTRFTPGNKRLAQIHNYLMTHYKEDMDLRQIALAVNMAEVSLCRFFKANTGMTLFEYLNKIKVDFACKMLMDKDMSIIEICLDSGFNNLSHFNKQFKKITGLPPSEYRKQYDGIIFA